MFVPKNSNRRAYSCISGSITYAGLLACYLVILLAASSCDAPVEKRPERSLAGGKLAGGVYHINMLRGNPNALDPVRINSKLADDVALQIYNRLISIDSELNIVPELAQSWQISEDGKTYTFNLRTDVRFQDNICFPDGKGRKMTAEDVRYSLTRCCDPQVQSTQFWAFKGKVAGALEYHDARAKSLSHPATVSGLRAPNDSTFVIELTAPYAPFLFYLLIRWAASFRAKPWNTMATTFFKTPSAPVHL